MIPNIIHFIYGMEENNSKEEFLFPYYLSIYSSYIVNNPEKIYIHYYYQPYGLWWDKLKEIPAVEFVKVELPTHIGRHTIEKTIHRADILRMNVLYNVGGVYMDIDTISVRPYKELLQYKTVLGLEHAYKKGTVDKENYKGICNAVLLTEPKSDFFTEWLKLYEKWFNPKGWAEACVILPKKIADRKFKDNSHVKVLQPEFFFSPHWSETRKIFKDNYDIPEQLITLHYWSTCSFDFYKKIQNWEWMYTNSHTLFGKIMLKLNNYYASLS